MCDFFILGLDTCLAIYDINDDIGFADSQFGLITHTRKKVVILIDKLDAARINHRKFLTQPFCIKIDAVSRNAGNVFDNGNPFLYDCIEQCRFTDIRPAYNGN